jgi:hypothetical protein
MPNWYRSSLEALDLSGGEQLAELLGDLIVRCSRANGMRLPSE